jgi:hypothetical protein
MTMEESPAATGAKDEATRIDLAPVREFLDLDRRRDELKAELKRVEAKMDALESPILSQLTALGSGRVDLVHNGEPFCVHEHRVLTARPCTTEGRGKDDVVAALRESGWEDIIQVTYNTLTLDAMVREALADKRPVPAPLAAVLEIKEYSQVRVRSGSRSESTSKRAARNLKEMNGETP